MINLAKSRLLRKNIISDKICLFPKLRFFCTHKVQKYIHVNSIERIKWYITNLKETNYVRQYQNYHTMSDELSQFSLPNDQPIVYLQCKTAFEALTPKEKLYAHYMSQAAWIGGTIVLVQTSPEAPLIFVLLHKIFLLESIEDLKKSALTSDVTADEFTAFLIYACGIYGNMGNYKHYGDTKIIPLCPREKFETIIKISKAYQQETKVIQNLWNKVKDNVYSLNDKVKVLGLRDKGITTYFSANCTEDDAKAVNGFMSHKGLESVNARCFKTTRNDNSIHYEIRLASIETTDDPVFTPQEEKFKGATYKITRGDYSNILEGVNENLEKAKMYVANDNEQNMLEKYISHFKTGSLKDHKDGSRFWIKNKGPIVETYIGFIETYRDPAGERGEFEGFVAVVDKEMSRKFGLLVDKAEDLIQKLPWGKDFEKDKYLRPDFTSLDVLTFAGSMLPVGINIPNYDDIRQSEGFKNVSLGNVISASMTSDTLPFLSDEDQELVNKYRISSFEVHVGLHELLGHGSGKLFMKTGPNSFNFDPEKVKNPLTGEKIDKYFLSGETFDSKFGYLGSTYEECRAEAVGLYMSLDKDVLKIFGFEGQEADDIIYTNWLLLLWNGCAKALETYQPLTKQWLQAHARARYVLLRVCLEAGNDFVTVVETEPGKNLRIAVDRSKLNTVGKKVISDFLVKLQVYKSTGDAENMKKLFDKYSEVPETGTHPWAIWRDIVLAHSKPRKIYVYGNTFISDDGKDVLLKSYEPTSEGMIQSWVERFPSTTILDALVELYEKDKQHFITDVLEN